MKAILYLFLVLAACGFVLSVSAHCMALAGVPVPGGNLVFGLHLGIFVVWFPTVFISRQVTRDANPKDFWKVALAGCPVWMRRAVYILFGYAFLNFFVSIALGTGWPKHPQTSDLPPSAVRTFSGHWMLFYGAAFAVLYSRARAPELYRERKCPRGHVVSTAARFCPECGYDLSTGAGNA